MTEENVSQEAQKEEAQPKEADVVKTEKTEITPIERAEGILAKIDEKLKKSEEVTARMEKAAARMLLGGRAEAGTPQKSPEEKLKEEVDAEVKAALKDYNM